MTKTVIKTLESETFEISDSECLQSKPVLSVVMLVYNHAAYLAEAIESVLAQQTDFAFELLIGEDYSTDMSREIAMDYQAKYPLIIRIISSHLNVGMHENHRRLVDASRGQFIAYCEGDDYWIDHQKLQLQVNYLRAHVDVGAVHSDFDHIVFLAGRWRKLKRFHSRTLGPVPSGDIFYALLDGNFIQMCTLCVRSELDRRYLSSKFVNDNYSVVDWPLCLYVSAYSKIEYIDRPLAVYRKTPGSIMNSGPLAMVQTVQSCLAMVEFFCVGFSVNDSKKIRVFSRLHGALLSLALLADDKMLFEQELSWLASHDPEYFKPLRRRILQWLGKHSLVGYVLVRIAEARNALKVLLKYR